MYSLKSVMDVLAPQDFVLLFFLDFTTSFFFLILRHASRHAYTPITMSINITIEKTIKQKLVVYVYTNKYKFK